MEKSVKFIIIVGLLVTLSACSPRDVQSSSSSSEVNTSKSSSSSVPKSSSSSSESSSSSSSEEPKEQIAAHEGQGDPTLPENMKGSWISWRHTEYKAWGDISTYKKHTLYMSEGGNETKKLNYTVLFPETLKPNSVLEYDGKFKNDMLKVGSHPTAYYKIKSTETIMENEFLPASAFQSHPMTGEKYEVIDTTDNVVGGFYKTDKFCRYIGKLDDDNNFVEYVIDLGDNVITHMYFYVSEKATADDLKIYDAMVKSVTLIDKVVDDTADVVTIEEEKKAETEAKTNSFVGTISGINGSAATITIDDGYDIRSSGDKVVISLANADENTIFVKGDKVKVEYDGGVMESYPLQLRDQKSVSKIK